MQPWTWRGMWSRTPHPREPCLSGSVTGPKFSLERDGSFTAMCGDSDFISSGLHRGSPKFTSTHNLRMGRDLETGCFQM